MLKKALVFATFVGFAFTLNIPTPAYALKFCISHKHTGTGRSLSKRTAKIAARAKWRFEVLLDKHVGKNLWSQAKDKSISCRKKYGAYKCRAQAIPCFPNKVPGSSSGKQKEPAYREIRNIRGRCLDVAGGVNANGTNVQIFDCNGSRSQQWQYKRSTGEIRSNTGGRCLDVAGGVNANGTNVQIFTCNRTKSQRWILARRKQIRNTMGRCLNVLGGVNANGWNVQIRDCSTKKGQQWMR